MLNLYYRLAKRADELGLSREVDGIDHVITRFAQVAPVGLTQEQYIQDIYRRLATLASQIQQMQQVQQAASSARKQSLPSLMEQTGVQTRTQPGNPANTTFNLNGQAHSFEIQQ